LTVKRVLVVVPFLVGCFLNRLGGPESYTVTGIVTKIEHDERYEAPCGIQPRQQHACDDLPICCAYRVTITDSTGHRHHAWAFWPKGAAGLPLGGKIWANLVRQEVKELLACRAVQSATSAICPSEIAYVIPDDNHWGRVYE
jgi:hypothetical protein